MTTYRYQPQALVHDYVRGGIGTVLSGGLLVLSPSLPVTVIFAGLTALFVLFTLRTALRQRSRIEVDEESIALVPSRAGRLRWGEIDGVRLRYFSTRRSRDKGWMTMRIAAGRRRIEIDSSLDGFDAVVAQAAAVVRARALPIDASTRANLQASGHLLEAELRPQDVPLPFSTWRGRRAAKGPRP
jgi:hypothetical protein